MKKSNLEVATSSSPPSLRASSGKNECGNPDIKCAERGSQSYLPLLGDSKLETRSSRPTSLAACSLRLAAMLTLLLSTNFTNGQPSPSLQSVELKFISLDGRKIDLADLKGKVVLIDCWATWCGPCLKEMSHIKELYEKYHDKGFEVIGISMDEPTSEEKLKQIIKQKNLPWPQRFEGRGFNEDSFKKQYDIKSLPTVYLLDKQGNMVDINARGERLESLLKKYLEL